jgi:hypothetical protein
MNFNIDAELVEFVKELPPQVILSIPGVYNAVKEFYSEVGEVDVYFHNPPGVVRTVQDERDWERAKRYYARSAPGPESRWESADWATVMVIYKNIKAKRRRGR